MNLIDIRGESPTRRRIARQDVSAAFPEDKAAVADILERFAEQRLIILDDAGIEIAHDVLLTAWPLLRDLINLERDLIRPHRRFEEDATSWADSNGDRSLLYRGGRLKEMTEVVQRWEAVPGRYPVLNDVQREFLAVAARAETRAVRQRRSVAAILVVLVVISAATALVARLQARNATEQSDLATARYLDAQSEVIGGTNPSLARLLSAAAWRLSPSPETRYGMVEALADPALAILSDAGPATSLVFSPAGNILATVGSKSFGSDSLVRLWNVSTYRQIGAPIGGNLGPFASAAFSPNGKILAIDGYDTPHAHGFTTTVRLWDVRTKRQVGVPIGGDTQPVGPAAFSPNGQILATLGIDDRVRLWSVSTGRQVGLLPNAQAYLRAGGFSVGGGVLATATLVGGGTVSGATDTVRLWNIYSGQQIGTALHTGNGPVASMALNATGKTLAIASSDGTVQLWDIATHKQTGPPLHAQGGAVVS